MTGTNVRKRSVRISGHNTSITIEDAFWSALKDIAQTQNTSMNALISNIDKQNQGNLSSALRLYVLQDMQKRLAQ